jgi:hypothetical protein
MKAVVCLAFLSLAALVSRPAQAGFGTLSFTGDPTTGSVAFGANGSLSIVQSADLVTETSGPTSGASLPIALGTMTLDLGAPLNGSPTIGWYYPEAGSISIFGGLPFGSGAGPLFTGSFYSEPSVYPEYGPTGFVAQGYFAGTIDNPELTALLGVPQYVGYAGTVGAYFTGNPGGPAVLVGMDVQLDFYYATPEPSSIVLVGMGLAALGIGRVRRASKRA